MEASSRKVIIDTDPGIDDAMGIMMALEAHVKGQIDVVAFTVAFGNCTVEHGLRNLSAILSFFPSCQQIPIYAGNESGMVKKFHHTIPFHGVDGFNGVLHDRQCQINLQKESAALGLVKQTQIHEIFVICFAPLTNVALAMKVDPGFAHRVKGFYAMGGNSRGIGNASISGEFNFLADPEAAYVVLEQTPKPIILAPWELCGIDIHIPLTWRQKVLGSLKNEKIAFLNELEAAWWQSQPLFQGKWVPCDQVIMAVFLQEESCVKSRQKYWATVELHGERTRGQMVVEKRLGGDDCPMPQVPNVDMIESLDVAKLQNLLLSTFQR